MILVALLQIFTAYPAFAAKTAVAKPAVLHPFADLGFADDLDSSCDPSLPPLDVTKQLNDSKKIVEHLPSSRIVEECCLSTPSNWGEDWRKDARSKTNDPYFIGSKTEPGTSFQFGYPLEKLQNLYQYSPPQMIGHNSIPEPFEYSIPEKHPNEKQEEYDLRRLQAILPNHPEFSILKYYSQNIEEYVTLAGAGSQSRAYYIHDRVPSDVALKTQYSDEQVLLKVYGSKRKNLDQARRQLWAKENSKEVIKLRTPDPWHKGYEMAVKQIRRDLAMHGLFGVTAGAFKRIDEQGKRHQFIQIAPFTQNQEELKSGILRQPVAKGESAYDIAERVKKAIQGDESQLDYLKKNLNYKTLDEAIQDLSLLEQYYRVTKPSVSKYAQINKLEGPDAYNSLGKEIANYGYDMGVDGRNVFRDPETGRWVAVDP